MPGCLDIIQDNHAIGWAFVTDQPGTQTVIEILDGETPIANGCADLLRKDLVEQGFGDGHHGFAIPLPAKTMNARRPLRARIMQSGEWLEGEHLPTAAITTDPLVGNIDGIVDGIVFGWVKQTTDRALPSVVALLDDEEIASGDITAPRPDIVQQGMADAAHGYRVDLKRWLLSQGDHGKSIRIIHRDSGKDLAGSPLNPMEVRGWGHVADCDGIDLLGWATLSGPSETTAKVELWIDGEKVLEQEADLQRKDFASVRLQHTRCGFALSVPGPYLDGEPHTLVVRHKATGDILANGEQRFIATLRHGITYANNSIIVGWMFIEESPFKQIRVEAWEQGRRIASAQANDTHPIPPDGKKRKDTDKIRRVGLTLHLPSAMQNSQARRIRLTIAGTRQSATGKDILIGARAEIMRVAERAAQLDPDLRWWIHDYIQQLRQRETPDGSLYKEVPAAPDAPSERTLDVIIPVYKGRRETLDCIRSLLECGDPWPHDIILINDASPDPELSADLRRLTEAHPGITLLEHTRNQGFVASVNRGMALHPERDVILLNADTCLPTADWLSRLRHAAHADERIATVTPFSNRATICSLPRPQEDNDLPKDMTVTDLDRLCADANPGLQIDIPTAIGFCMFIKRQALDEVGYFDEARWGMGYGEENDFCLKASAIGWRHVAACDVFVQHHGAVSFQDEKQARIRDNLGLLTALYPDYAERVARFIRRDPLASARARIVLPLMRQSARHHVLHITHAWGGGVRRHVDELIEKRMQQGEAALILRPTLDERIELIQPATDLALSLPMRDLDSLSVPSPQSSSELLDTLRQLGVSSVRMHQWIGLPLGVWNLAEMLGVPFDYSLHDYYAACPRIHLLDHRDQFCEQPSLGRCDYCVTAKPLEHAVANAFEQLGGSMADWRAFHQARLATARQITAPCQDAATRIKQVFRLERVEVRPHDDRDKLFTPKPLPKSGMERRVAVIGAIGPNKGYDLLVETAQRAYREAPHLRFFLVGYTMDDTPLDALGNVQISGEYQPERLPDLLADSDCHLALFLSPWPETYSYTLSEALAAGLTPIVPNLGALGERVSALPAGWVLPCPMTSSQVIQALVQSAKGGKVRTRKPARGRQSTSL
ncbi:glycosyltransferase [Thiorhodococcus mannitoliphagus]|uniref:Glycosyltransferase n=1 Tax=Thiorhodococcus mannitoliphagus TaxID=329406 RepID=A0A6P1DPB3_9GAMM|nr:glycosyltransferase [Thiorhodococcus mannitoliphagus]NEX19400.1 glycosyltransferase [Thiorhodococcus mannitoliphagus]